MDPLPAPAGYSISTDKRHLDIDAIHAFLSRSYWSPGIPRAVVEQAIAHSLCFGLFAGSLQVGFARVITDRSVFAYLADVYVLEAHRGRGLSKWLLGTIQRHPDLQGLRRFMLATKDAQTLYAQFGFKQVSNPARLMEIVVANVYGDGIP